jgi:beta-lactamase superfamily II metal-dependent hydrolase
MSAYANWQKKRGHCVLASLVISILSVCATPPNYQTFHRVQQPNYSPDPGEVLRIWMVYVAQGDGLLIQLPSKHNYDPNPNDADTAKSEHIDIVVDGGANPTSEADRMSDFIQQIYGGPWPIIEYAVITHHDQDHVTGITRLLTASDGTFDTIYHNGLASYRGGKHGLPQTANSSVVADVESNQIKRAMGKVNAAGEFEAGFLIQNLADLKNANDNDELQGIYDDLAKAVTQKANHNELKAFQRASYGGKFISERQSERGQALTDVKFNVLWPQAKAKSYGGNDWGETINGNSVTFQMVYKDFAMVFTGDQNDRSEPELLTFLRAEHKIDLLDCDVLKVPHHGSSHGVQEFFKRQGFEPVLAIASMGDKGFQSKAMDNRAWQHPSTDVIDWLGGPHRVYHTFVQEKAFRWTDITTAAKRKSMIEKAHILIETDGRYFRLVEIPLDANPLQPPTVTETRRGNGTQWIKASTN